MKINLNKFLLCSVLIFNSSLYSMHLVTELLLSQEESNVAQAKIEYQKIVHEASERDIKGSYFAALDKMKQVNQLLVLARKENDAALERFASRPVSCEISLKTELKARFDETSKIVEKVNNDLIICMKVCQLFMSHSK